MAKKEKQWKYVFIVQPFNWTLNIVTPSSLEAFRKFRLKAGGDSIELEQCYRHISAILDNKGACYIQWNGVEPVVALPDHFDCAQTYHEAFHCATLLWEHAGANLAVPENDEVLTYTADHVVREIKAVYDALIDPPKVKTKKEKVRGDK